MRLLIDIAIIALLVLMGWRGWRNGIINGVSGIIAIVLAIYGANLVASTYSGDLIDVIEPFATGYIEGVTSDILDYNPEDTLEETGGDTDGETDIVDESTPTGSLPQTGTLVQTSAARAALGILALTASLMAAGLALVLFRKSRKA